MKKKNLLSVVLALVVTAVAWAVPARPGLWKTVTTPDGRQLRMQLCGDERTCFWQSADGRCFVEQAGGVLVETTVAQLAADRKSRAANGTSGRLRAPHKGQTAGHFTGKKKGLIILAEFQDKQFLPEHNRDYYERVANERGFSEGDYRGSVKDYFLSQSRGQFELDFDVVGPVTVSHDYQYYGQPGTVDVDAAPWEMVVEACELVKEQVNFADYDWNGDGYCEQVFVLYAGQGQSDSYDVNTIWPHEYELHSVTDANGLHLYGDGYQIGSAIIDVYACSNELTHTNTPSGIGTFCHEFSHCMGLPDLYDTYYGGNFGMGHWDIMANGVYNGDAFVPAGYTSYERMVCGWLDPMELGDDDVSVEGMKPLTADDAIAYIIYNKAHPDEYYLLENRQLQGWDAALPSAGLLVLHVDYDERVWQQNIVNSIVDNRKTPGHENEWNTHQRLTLVHADNDNDKRYWMASQQYYTKTTEETDPFPYKRQLDDGTWSVLDSLTNNSVPTATVYNANTDNGLYLNRGLQAITQNDDGTMSFRYDAVSEKYVAVDTTMTDKPDLTGAVFYESFDKCIGTGGNDGVFKGSSDVASADFVPDNGGWDSMVMKGGARCAKFGNASYDGFVTSPSIMLTGDSLELCFKAAPWSRDDTDLTLSLSNGQLGQTTFEMAEGQWTTFTTTIMGEGPTQITFTPGRRFFLDEVVVRRSFTSGIKEIDNSQFTIDNSQFTIDNSQLKVYDLQGRPAASGTHGILLKRMADGRVVKVIGK